MAVLIEGISVVIKVESIFSKYPGGWGQFKQEVPNKTLCSDNELARVGFMAPDDVRHYCNFLSTKGLIYLADGQAQDIVVADQIRGFTCKCTWAEFGHVNLNDNSNQKITACRILNSDNYQVFIPVGWSYEHSLSKEHTFIENRNIKNRTIPLENENNLDTFLDKKAGDELYLGRTSRHQSPNKKSFFVRLKQIIGTIGLKKN
ncbi:hypothetical protein [Dethiosulfatarculus sandiegensis]|uniref:Uncharacterized protein n=1 Tax=Dethiosulfatarculus sandiegensis TaxID=1429043 RepID=A0A0D2JPY9_9BACT|nr:hypothetical protein [Dethiosulfatarculus sandiegensis]KIX11525.1 hypothetical protein X474_23805 [Dethiosulfatarculus sandiegensis]